MLHSIDQVCTRRPSFNISSLSVHRFIIAAITVLSKAFCDAFSPNPLFAKVGGVSLIELNLLEKEFLSAMDWRLACTREVLHYYYVKLVRTHSSGNYIVPDTSPRPAPIDTLPSDEIEWNELSRSPSSLANMKGTKKGDVSDGSLSGGHNSSISMDEGTESDSSDEDGSSQMVTSMRSPHRLLSRGTSQNNSPALSTSSSKRAYRQTLPKSGFAGSATSSSATVEQSVAFSEMRSTSHHHRLSNSSSPLQGPSAMSGISTVSAPRSPATSFRSPVVGRRRRRSTTQMNAPSVASTLLSVDAPDPAVLEGLIRGSSRRRLHMDGNDTRLEVEPSTPR
ncbi:hypothetical protein FRC18_001194 [Serendipita sp. 400]|nr:hypothetical protein FRC18_001194 [Serendipita sp. 400]